MVRINLLPPRYRRHGPAAQNVVILSAATFAALLLLVYAGFYLSLVAARHDLMSVEHRLALLQPAEENMRQVEDLQQTRERKRAILLTLTQQNRSWHDAIVRLSAHAQDTIWFSELSGQDRNSLQVKGWARNYQDLADFVHRLEGDAALQTVTVTEARMDTKMPLTDFTLIIYFK